VLAVGKGVVVIVVAVVLVALLVTWSIRDRQKRHAEARRDLDEAHERAARAERDRDAAQEQAKPRTDQDQ
jgi:uncharacterized membrane protein